MKSRRSAFRALIFFAWAVVLAQLTTETASAAARKPPFPVRETLWAFDTKGSVVSSPCLSVDGLTLYVGSRDGNLYAIPTDGPLDGTDGKPAPKWKLKLPAAVLSSPVTDSEGRIYVGCADGKLYGISDQGDSGRIEMRGVTARKSLSSPALAGDGTIYIGSSDNHLYAFFPDGARKWAYITPDDAGTPVVRDDGSLLVVAGGFLKGVSEDGSEESSFIAGGAIHSIPAVADDGTIYLGANDDRVYALNSGATTNDIRWRFNTRNNVVSSPAVGADGRIYIASENLRLYCLTTNGAVRWSVATRGAVHAPLSIGVDGTIYAGADDKRLYAISSEGEILWTVNTRAPVRSSPALDAFGVVYFGSGKTVYAVQTEAMADDTDEPAWQMFRKDAQHSARATECRPFLIEEPHLAKVTGPAGATNITEFFDFYTVTNGENVSLSVVVRAGASLSYQWRVNGTDIESTGNSSATNATLLISAPTAADAGDYTVSAFNDCGEVESDTFTLNVNAPPDISSQPTNQFVLAGNSVKLAVAASGNPPLRYQWFFIPDVPGGTNFVTNIVATATNSTLTFTNIQTDSAGRYFVQVANNFGTNTSLIATVQVFNVALDFAKQPLGAGQRHSLAVLTNQTLWAWGLDNFGQLGDANSGSTATNFVLRSLPQLIGTNGTATTNAVWLSISGGSRGYDPATNQPGGFSLGIQTNGTLWAWGLNDRGQLGIDSTNLQRVPVRVGTETNWVQVEAGAAHAIALRRDGSIWSWGANEAGQLGLGTTNANATVPVRVGTDSAWVEVRAGGNFTLARRADGTLWAWGTNAQGQLGIGTSSTSGTNALRRAPVMIGTNADWAGISAGGFHSLGLKTNGTLWSWGRNNFGQLGLGTGAGDGRESFNVNHPQQVGTNTDWALIEAGTFHSFSIGSTGTLYGWGANFFGQLGNGRIGSVNSTNDENQVSPVPIATDKSWSFVDASTHSLGMTTNGDIYAWGLNNNGQVGDGTGGDGTRNNNRSTPVLLSFVVSTNNTATNPPSISAQPASQTVLQGGTATFSVGASGTTPLAYQWFFNSVAISSAANNGATNFALQIANARAENVGAYFVIISNQFGQATSSIVTLTVTNSSGGTIGNTLPGITQQPLSQFAGEGSNVTFSVTVTGTPPVFFYQWYYFSNVIAAETNSILTVTNLQGSLNAGFYSVVVSNSVGAVTSVLAGLTITNADTVFFPTNGGSSGIALSNSAPFIIQQPASQSALTNSTVEFTVLANGAVPLNYQWYQSTNALDGATNTTATNATLVLSNVTDSISLRVVITNDFGTITSAVVILLVTNGPGGIIPDQKELSIELSEFRLGTVKTAQEGVVIEMIGAEGRKKLVLEYKDSLGDAEWKPLSTNDSGGLKFIDSRPAIDRSRFYRVRAE